MLRGEAKPQAAPKGTGATAADAIQIKQRILQYQKKANKPGVMGVDVSQTAGPLRWILVLVALAAFAGIFYVVRTMVAGAGSDAPEEAPP